MSLYVKKINHQFSVLKKPELSGFFHAHTKDNKDGTYDCTFVIARLCRAFFMHDLEETDTE